MIVEVKLWHKVRRVYRKKELLFGGGAAAAIISTWLELEVHKDL